MDFRIVAFEATFAGSLKLNDYVQTGQGTAEEALAELVYPAWRNEAVLDLVKWMREYNTTHTEKVQFYGFDNKPAMGSAEFVQDYLNRTGATREYDELLSSLKELCTTGRQKGKYREDLRQAKDPIKDLIAYLKDFRPNSLTSVSNQTVQDRTKHDLAIQHAQLLLQNAEFHAEASITKASNLRDKRMAENVKWILDHNEGEKIILWAANPHVTTLPGSGCMGDYLRRIYGYDIVNFGLLRNRIVREGDAVEISSVETIQGGGSNQNCVEGVFTQAGLESAIIDLRNLPKGAVSKYFTTPRSLASSLICVLPWMHDAILFLESTTEARLVKPKVCQR